MDSHSIGADIRTLAYDPVGQITTVDDARHDLDIEYDLLGRLLEFTSTPVAGGAVLPGSQAFEYDKNGNRTELDEDGNVSNYSISSSSNRLTAITGAGARTYTYDAAGNVIDDGTHSYGYDDRGRLTSVDLGAVTYQHNALGQRVLKNNGSNTLFAYDEGGRLIGEYDAVGSPIQETVYFQGAPVAVLQGSNVYPVHSDQLGTPRAITDAGTVIWRWESDPFGSTAPDEDPDGNMTPFTYNLRFPGQYFDQETGLHYNYHRTYDPSTGRYLESDPIGLDGGLNTYGYVGANPVRYFDPDGLRARVRCRLVPVIGGITRARHCYVEVDPDDGGDTETYGLIGNTGGPLSRTGTIYKNNAFDTGGTSCEWNDEPTVDQCVRDAVAEYANPSNYRFVRGPNSNTFAGTIARKCGLAKPKGFAPGWNDEPAEQKKDTEYQSPVDLR